MKQIKLYNGMIAVVDDEDFDRVKNIPWHLNGYGNSSCYVIGSQKSQRIILHRFLMNAPRGTVVDHINGNPLDNRKENLRLCTIEQNARNTRTKKECRGVIERGDRFEARYYPKGVYKRIGLFDTREEALRAYDATVIKERGEFAPLNFPNGYESILPDRLVENFKQAKRGVIKHPNEY